VKNLPDSSICSLRFLHFRSARWQRLFAGKSFLFILHLRLISCLPIVFFQYFFLKGAIRVCLLSGCSFGQKREAGIFLFSFCLACVFFLHYNNEKKFPENRRKNTCI